MAWVFVGAAVLHLLLVHYRPLYRNQLNAVDGVRNILLSGILCAIIAGVLKLP